MMNPASNDPHSWWRRFLRYLLIGCINTGIGLAVYWVLLHLGLRPWQANGASNAVGLLASLYLNSRFTFASRAKLHGLLLPYLLCALTAWGANLWMLDYLLNLGLPPLLAQLGAMAVFTCLLFCLLHTLVFRAPTKPQA